MKATAKDLRVQSKRLLEAVDRGAEVVITYRGKPRARLVPPGAGGGFRRDTGLFGLWRDRDDLDSAQRYVDELRASRF